MSKVDLDTTDFVSAMAQLLSNPALRQQFADSPESVASELGLQQKDWPAFVALEPKQVDQQAETLLNKRWHEVRRLVPQTIDELGDEAIEIFRYYATNAWPQGHRRHPVDAYRFLKFLLANEMGKPCKTEIKRLRRMAN